MRLIRTAMLRTVAVSLAFLTSAPANAQSMKVRATGFSDVNFGTVIDFSSTARQSQSLCIYANSNGDRYSITATGSGPGGGFALSDGANLLTYAVEWNASAGQSNGTQLSANVPLTGQATSAQNQGCSSGPATTASLIVALRPSDLRSAFQGSYSGTLSVTVTAE